MQEVLHIGLFGEVLRASWGEKCTLRPKMLLGGRCYSLVFSGCLVGLGKRKQQNTGNCKKLSGVLLLFV